jgi:hypothetical protein
MYSANDIEDHLKAVQRTAHSYTTNCLFPSNQLTQWSVREKIIPIFIQSDCLVFGLKEAKCTRLFYAGERAVIPQVFSYAMKSWAGPLTVDIIGRAGENNSIIQEWYSIGFHEHVVILRLVRTAPWKIDNPEIMASTDVVTERDATNVLKLMDENFDQYADRIPDEIEIGDAIREKKIIAVKNQGVLIGFLWYDRIGLTSTIRFWCVSRAIQGGGVGGGMIRAYRQVCGDVRRHLLWVRDNNSQARACYQHYGYVADGLEDHVLLAGV